MQLRTRSVDLCYKGAEETQPRGRQTSTSIHTPWLKRTAGPSIMLFISERTYAQTGSDKFTVLEGTEYHVRKCGGVS